MVYGRAYLMGECEVMAPRRERYLTRSTPMLALSCHRRQASPIANDDPTVTKASRKAGRLAIIAPNAAMTAAKQEPRHVET
jgi:hypothetical protein